MTDQPETIVGRFQRGTLLEPRTGTSGDAAKQPDYQSTDLPKLQQFEVVELLGEGGMGSVYKAWDPKLERWIAVKFLRSADPALIERFSREAKAQARVQHDHICPVYEVGDEDRRPFIAMALVEGIDLQQAIQEMSTEQAIQIFIDVANALHAAHKTGLVHRDVKPSNIMVEYNEQHGWHAWVMDFGIAREVSKEGKTATGVVLGTPAYMAPEQVSGERGSTDRRTDVYGLGATLYEAFTEKPPFDGITGIEILLHVASDEPRPPRSLTPNIPVDLETIILKCLEKDPRRRYDTAHALGVDLQRFLDGDPILARRAEWSYRLGKKIRKHKALAAVAAISLIAITTLAGIAATTAYRARERTELAREFGQQMTRMENSLRIASLLQPHDIRPERARVRSQMADIREQMSHIGSVADGPGHYILGRGHLALDELPEARANLETAWSGGFATPEAAYALGLTLGKIYEEELTLIQRTPDDDTKAAQLERLHHEFRDPALEYLGAARNLPPAGRAYAKGLIALYEQRWDDALRKTREAINLDPALFEAQHLEGRIHANHGKDLVEAGEFDKAETSFTLAATALQSAVDTARSDPAIHEALCRLKAQLIELTDLRGQLSVDLYDKAVITCQRALTIDPDRAEILTTTSRVHWRWAKSLMNRGKDPRAVLEEATRLAQDATQADPQSNLAFNDLGVTFNTLALQQVRSGEDPTDTFNQAVAAFDEATRIKPSAYNSHNNRGLAFWRWGNWQGSQGIEPLKSWQHATENFETALTWFPKSTYSLGNLGAVRLTMALYETERGIDPNASLDGAITAFTSALEINPRLATALSNLGATHTVRAEWQLKHGVDPRPSIKEASVIFERSAEINPRNRRVYNNLGSAAASQALYEYRKGLDALPSLHRATESFARALELDPHNITALWNRAAAWRMHARISFGHGEDPGEYVAAALRDLKAIITINPRISGTYIEKAQLNRLQAESKTSQGLPARRFLDMAENATNRALEINASEAATYVEKSRILLLRAMWSDGREKKKFLQLGINAAKKALEINPDNAEAHMMCGAHELRLALENDDSSKKSTLATSALVAFNRGIELDPLFDREFAEDLAKTWELNESP